MKITIKRASALLLAACSGIAWASQPMKPEAAIWYQGEGPGSVKSGAGDTFASTQWGFELPLEEKSRRAEYFQSRFHFDWTEFDWQGANAAEGEYLWLSMPIHYRQQRGRKHQFLLHVEPGLMTDAGSIGFDHIGLNGSAIGRILMRNGGYWQFGAIVDRQFGDYNARPVLGLGWQAGKRTWIDLGFPETNIQHTLSSTLQSYLHVGPAGGVWRHSVEGQSKDVNLSYTNWQAGVGLTFHWRKSLWLNAEIGQLRNRRVKGYTDAATSVKATATPGDDRYWKLGAEIRF